ncbi:Putative fatty-acid--CoA ligase (Acyl-CoA synthetase) [Bradyrhizobium sp. ORS 278]|uniref:fatty acyl-AMP ligase n=1 Tax=Bradyrhizobium sp. (strain ORS 278) TaxID=114615 RepID=UPI0001508DC9|nr:fatty acyl-AMP ligase [Bradyrhizobium sp. ORS 278]CAL79308.1 Putative fatty-acid--CoA ligase (Acyl-CoA synthetase) [Bradyrhizobium sp. ORS 278]
MDQFGSLVALLAARAQSQADDPAYLFLNDRGTEESRLTFGDLQARARDMAARLADHAAPGDRALLVFPPGLEFFVAFFGCLIAGIIAVPMMMPRRLGARDASGAIIADCAPRLALSSSAFALRGDLRERFARDGLTWLEVDLTSSDAGGTAPARRIEADDVAFLQYTSGSTSEPKGVAVSHANLLANSEMIRIALGNSRSSTYVNWVPLYHDMGLILNALQTLYVGSLCVLMAPNAFTQRPLNWLRAIGRYRAEVACCPNFGYDLCAARYRADQMQDVDLSCWKVALNGAEPVRADTLHRFTQTFAPHGFAAEAIYPAYGMAEATLLISGGRRGAGPLLRELSHRALQTHRAEAPSTPEDSQVVVGCGRALAGEQIAIVDPESCRRLACDEVGEIWVAGPNVARSYWRNPEATVASLRATITGDASGVSWLRTGDLGFLDADGELFITGRIKDLLIIRGVNHYPQDIEHTVQATDPALRPNCGAAFSVPDEDGSETLAIVQEVERTERKRIDLAELTSMIRERVTEQHEVFARHIALIRPGQLPKTTSGKIQRRRARQMWLDGQLPPLDGAQ